MHERGGCGVGLGLKTYVFTTLSSGTINEMFIGSYLIGTNTFSELLLPGSSVAEWLVSWTAEGAVGGLNNPGLIY